MNVTWHPWAPVPTLPRFRILTQAVLSELLDGGQAFRWQRRPDGTFEGHWSTYHVRIRLGGESNPARSTPPRSTSGTPEAAPTLEFAAPAYADLAATREAVHAYLAGPPADADDLPWRSDPHLAAAMAAFPGLHILRQPFGETLLGFVCSATKQIVQIKQMMAALAARHGQRLPDACHALPTWGELASVPEEQLRACALGFRARHVAGIAARLAADPGWLAATEHAPYAEAKERLLTLPGVGEKVADCVLLFGAGRLEAFPVDTWIIKAMTRRYALDGWKPAQIAHFGRTHFGAQAGLAQQYLFAHERSVASRQNLG